jgi:hypothetical protein
MYVAFKGANLSLTKGTTQTTRMTRIKNKMTQSLSYRLIAGLTFVILLLACNGQNANNDLKLQNKTIDSNTARADQSGISQPQGQQQQFVPYEVLVKFNPDTNPQTIERIQAELKLETIREFRSPNLFLMKITDGMNVAKIIEKLKTYPSVQYAEPNYVVKTNQ